LFHVDRGPRLQESMNIWFRVAGTALASLMLLMLTVRASTCVSHERERDTLDALLTTPIGSEAILGAKLLGCLTSMRMAWLWFGSMLAIAVLTGGLHILAVPLVIGAWCAYAVLFTMVGMWFSMVCRSSMRATVLSVLTTLFLGGGHWVLMFLCCFFPLLMTARGGGSNDGMEYIVKFEAAMTPPFVMGFLSFSWDNLAHDFHRNHRGDIFGLEMFVFCLIGMFMWGAACFVLWYGVLIPKFREITRREELIYE
jgi:ABC-type transport system involved in multi-copper enzyme maturation permease subunit